MQRIAAPHSALPSWNHHSACKPFSETVADPPLAATPIASEIPVIMAALRFCKVTKRLPAAPCESRGTCEVIKMEAVAS